MDTEKIYRDTNGNKCNIFQMIRREPEWAANVIQLGEKSHEELCKLKAMIADEHPKALRDAYLAGAEYHENYAFHRDLSSILSDIVKIEAKRYAKKVIKCQTKKKLKSKE